MKKTIQTLVLLCLSLIMCLSVFTACGNKKEEGSEAPKLTEEAIKTALAEDEGTLTIEGSADNVTAFQFVVKDINATKLSDKSFSKTAINTLLSNPSNITFGQLKVCNAVSAMMSISQLLNKSEGDFNSDAYIEEILSVVCEGKTKQYGAWSVSAVVDQAADSITFKATSK